MTTGEATDRSPSSINFALTHDPQLQVVGLELEHPEERTGRLRDQAASNAAILKHDENEKTDARIKAWVQYVLAVCGFLLAIFVALYILYMHSDTNAHDLVELANKILTAVVSGGLGWFLGKK